MKLSTARPIAVHNRSEYMALNRVYVQPVFAFHKWLLEVYTGSNLMLEIAETTVFQSHAVILDLKIEPYTAYRRVFQRSGHDPKQSDQANPAT